MTDSEAWIEQFAGDGGGSAVVAIAFVGKTLPPHQVIVILEDGTVMQFTMRWGDPMIVAVQYWFPDGNEMLVTIVDENPPLFLMAPGQ